MTRGGESDVGGGEDSGSALPDKPPSGAFSGDSGGEE